MLEIWYQSRFTSQGGEGGGAIWPLNEHVNPHFNKEQDIQQAPESVRKVAMALIWIC